MTNPSLPFLQRHYLTSSRTVFWAGELVLAHLTDDEDVATEWLFDLESEGLVRSEAHVYCRHGHTTWSGSVDGIEDGLPVIQCHECGTADDGWRELLVSFELTTAGLAAVGMRKAG